jgi:hypothetical protein
MSEKKFVMVKVEGMGHAALYGLDLDDETGAVA